MAVEPTGPGGGEHDAHELVTSGSWSKVVELSTPLSMAPWLTRHEYLSVVSIQCRVPSAWTSHDTVEPSALRHLTMLPKYWSTLQPVPADETDVHGATCGQSALPTSAG